MSIDKDQPMLVQLTDNDILPNFTLPPSPRFAANSMTYAPNRLVLRLSANGSPSVIGP